ncbi:chaperone NapD [Shewanella sp. NIFS-20-20]|uniref:chaperone NapD n=1 Tax=Shewanella sp. NIFS-20-20 TaxID=2853806 RepID=UPI001C4672B9|nr:chaperone NapD [Shewanella sp. NIFS-20-20]MBV7314097.1 chaperone NapD [Shewanella sp. NIFS-20-20]
MSDEYHITSLVVHASASELANLQTQICALQGAELHATSPEGKLIVTLEASRQQPILDNVEIINSLPGVLSSSLIYHQVDNLEQQSEITP